MPVQIARWDSARDAWTDEARIDLFSGLSDAFLGTFPTSGMTLNGVAYELPTWEPAMDDSESSSSPDEGDLLGTPTSRMWKGAGPQGGATQIRNKARGLIEAQVMDIKTLPTPTVSDTNGAGKHGDGGLDLRTAVSLLPTPTTQPETGNGHARNLGKEAKLLQTPLTTTSTGVQELERQIGGRGSRGETMSQQSDDGRLDSEGQLPGQQNLLDELVESA